MIYRNFVLYPLREVSLNWTHPKTKKNISDLIKDLKTPNNEITKLSLNDIMQFIQSPTIKQFIESKLEDQINGSKRN